MEIMNLCVLHLSDVEREAGNGVDREELIQWYLEQKEVDFETEEDLEYERALIGKALHRLARDNYLLEIRGDVREGLAPPTGEEAESMETAQGSAADKVYYVVRKCLAGNVGRDALMKEQILKWIYRICRRRSRREIMGMLVSCFSVFGLHALGQIVFSVE